MCGITGWVDFERDLIGQRAVVEAMTATMPCRGPDAAGTWCSQRALIGHRRLAAAFAANPALGSRMGLLPSPMAATAFLLDVNEWLTEYRVSLV